MATATDHYLAECVIEFCSRPVATKDGRRLDFCAECIDDGKDVDQFGRCYVCRDFGDHERCIGVPCQCPCPTPDQIARQRERDAALSKLTPAERQVLGF
jgi:hypothetical protein